ncbi:MAG: metal-dependent hydrolase [Pseudomonadota bacterium]
MDTLTHALSGALVARATWNKNTSRLSLRQRTLVGFLATAFPDIDYIIRLFSSDFIFYLNHHRGITHSLVMLPLWALVLAFLFSKLLRPKTDWRMLYPVCCIGIGLHIGGDVITSYGTMIFAPFSDWRASLDTTFIIDPVFTGIIVASLLLSFLLTRKQGVAAIGSIVLVAYVGLQAWAHNEAVKLGERAAGDYLWQEATVSALPQPLSPFNWKIVVEHEEHYHIGMVRLFGEATKADNSGSFLSVTGSAYYQPENIQWERLYRYGENRHLAEDIWLAWMHDTLDGYRRFARFPRLIENRKYAKDCYWFSDLRFELPHRDSSPLFTVGLCEKVLGKLHRPARTFHYGPGLD